MEKYSYCELHDTYPVSDEPCWQCVREFTDKVKREKRPEEIKKLRDILKVTRTFLLRLEATSICGKISTTKGYIYTMRKKLDSI
jgi:hypothetical protein